MPIPESTDPEQDLDLNSRYWRELQDKSAMAGITLDASISPEDFARYGDRITARQFEMFDAVGGPPYETSSILEIGCGMGRLLRPFSERFKHVTGVDINQPILDTARAYVGERNHVELIQNDGRTVPFPNNSFDYVFCGGVLQHIPDIDVITGYFREGLRVLKPGGVLNFSIMVWMTSRKGGVHGDRVGAKVVSADIDAILNDTGHNLLAIYTDPKDPYPHFHILIRKQQAHLALLKRLKRRREPFKIKHDHITNMNVRTGIFEDLPSYSTMREQWATGERRRVTFFWKPH